MYKCKRCPYNNTVAKTKTIALSVFATLDFYIGM